MPIENIPQVYLADKSHTPDLFIYDFRMTSDVVKTKVNLGMHMFSFLQVGKKQIHFADTSVLVDNSQSLLIKQGNSLWTELLDNEDIYCCKLLFFSEKRLQDFLNHHLQGRKKPTETTPYFVIENDAYLLSYLNTLSTIATPSPASMAELLSVKFDELLLYLTNKYKTVFENYLLSLVSQEVSSFKKTVEQNVYSPLSLGEISFLCNMSLSTFKRHFINEYNATPGKWLREQRLVKAKELLAKGDKKSSDIYHELGYSNLSNFSSAFKNKFGMSPTEV